MIRDHVAAAESLLSSHNPFKLMIRILFPSALLAVSILGSGLTVVRAESSLPPGAADMPPGYTLSKTALPGKHCYHYGGDHTYFYCYPRAISASEIKSHDAMMMKKDDSMMMMKKDDSMMQGK
ncbi:MAG: hypothetical protein WCD18_23265 [Thermosynechococcaceae cyanobacterium]